MERNRKSLQKNHPIRPGTWVCVDFQKFLKRNQRVQTGLFENKESFLVWEGKNSPFLKYFSKN